MGWARLTCTHPFTYLYLTYVVAYCNPPSAPCVLLHSPITHGCAWRWRAEVFISVTLALPTNFHRLNSHVSIAKSGILGILWYTLHFAMSGTARLQTLAKFPPRRGVAARQPPISNSARRFGCLRAFHVILSILWNCVTDDPPPGACIFP